MSKKKVEKGPLLAQAKTIRRFNRFYTRYIGFLDKKYLKSTVSLTEARILYEIGRRPQCRAKDLMNRLNLDRGYLSRLIHRLEKVGLIQREQEERDRRARRLELTDRGDILLQTLKSQATIEAQDILRSLSEADRDRLIEAMESIETILSGV